ncbi:MAG TPA: hypothetical protein VH796_06600 [Nitrososphaeraceae archaeon]
MNAYLINILAHKSTDDRSDTITRSFRFDQELSKVLDEEAERMGVSVNSVVGIILRRFADFTRFLSKIDMVIINRELLTTLINSLDENTISTLGSNLGESVPRDTIVFWKKDLTDEAVFEYIEKIMCRYGHLGTYDEVKQSAKRTIVVRHRLGKKGSKFFESFFRSMFKNTTGKESSFELTDASIKIEVSY